MAARPRATWWVYFVRCADDSLYCGATNDVQARVAKHDAGKGARYTRSRRPVVLAWKRRCADRSAALSLEARLKRWTRAEKLALVAGTRRVRSAPRRQPRTGA